MNPRLQKLQKIKIPGKPESSTQPSTNPVNQTIIINNPNININYMNQHGKVNPALQTRGVDNWNLNNNLKEFSQTRQLGFFKKKERNKSNSPYIIHKVRTQDIRSINKIYANGNNTMKDTVTGFRKNDTIGNIQPVGLEYQKQHHTDRSHLQRVMNKRDKTITQKFYQGQARKNPRIQMLKNFQTLPTNHLANPQHSLNQTGRTKHFRKGRFQPATQRNTIQPVTLLDSSRAYDSRQSNDSIDSPTKRVKMQEKEDRDIDSAESEIKLSKNVGPRMVNLQLRRRAFNKTIASIDKLLLSNAEDYFDRSHSQKLPQSEIQLCVNSLSHPERVGLSKEKSSKKESSGCGEYDFMFEEEKKKRPRTPRRKKMYQPL